MSACGYSRRTRSKSVSNQSMPQLRVDAALNHDLRRALVDRVLHALEHRVVRHRVAFFVMLGPEERAKGAVHVADVRVVDRRVDDVGDDVARMHRQCAARARRRPDRGCRPRRRAARPRRTSSRPPAAARSSRSASDGTDALRETRAVPRSRRSRAARGSKRSSPFCAATWSMKFSLP